MHFQNVIVMNINSAISFYEFQANTKIYHLKWFKLHVTSIKQTCHS